MPPPEMLSWISFPSITVFNSMLPANGKPTSGGIGHQRRQERSEAHPPSPAPAHPLDVADLVHFLVTEGYSITGQIIRVDGGRSIT
jgi:hypothetical protein